MKKSNKFFMFLDDDIVFKKNSFVEMRKFIKKNEKLYMIGIYNMTMWNTLHVYI